MDTTVTSSLEDRVYPSIAGGNEVHKNERLPFMLCLGEIGFDQSSLSAVSPGGLKISAYLQQQMCRLGTGMVSEESEEALNGLHETGSTARQTKRFCHHYGENLHRIHWLAVYSDGVHLRLPFNLFMDGSLLLKKDKVSDVIPSGYPAAFIAHGARRKWIEDDYPDSREIEASYDCKEYIDSLVKEYFTEKEVLSWVEDSIDTLKTRQVDLFLTELEELEVKHKCLLKNKNKLLAYWINSKERSNYVTFVKKGLLTSSGAIESVHSPVIQKSLKRSGQCRTVQGAKQLLNLKTGYKSNGYLCRTFQQGEGVIPLRLRLRSITPSPCWKTKSRCKSKKRICQTKNVVQKKGLPL